MSAQPLKEVRIFSPATVANVACGFDVLGFCIDAPGDEIVARFSTTPGLRITKITGDDGRLPLDSKKNTAGVSAHALLRHLGKSDLGIEMEIHKKMPFGSGLGSSAASAVLSPFRHNGGADVRVEFVHRRLADGDSYFLVNRNNVAATAVGNLAGNLISTDATNFNATATLGTLALYRGLAEGISQARSVRGYPDWFYGLGQGEALGAQADAVQVIFVTVDPETLTTRFTADYDQFLAWKQKFREGYAASAAPQAP